MTRRDGKEETMAVAIDKDKGSQHALKWAVDHLLNKGQCVTLLHVKQRPSSIPATADVSDVAARAHKEKLEAEAKELFLPFRVFCTRKDIHCNEVLIEEMDIAKGIIDYVTNSATEVLILGSPSRGGFMRRFKTTDMPSFVSKGAPDFCTVYIINKGKISSVRSSTRPSPVKPRSKLQNQPSKSFNKQPDTLQHRRSLNPKASPERSPNLPRIMSNDSDFRSPFTRPSANKSYDPSLADTDISYVSSGRPSTDRLFPFNNDNQLAHGAPPRMSIGSDQDSLYSFASLSSGSKSMDISSAHYDFSNSHEGTSWSSQSSEDVEAEMRRLKLELKQTIDMYSTACKEALTANQRAVELQRWKMEEEQRLEEARLAEEAALAIAEKEKAKCREALEAAEAAQRIADLEAQKRRSAEMKAIVENDENNPTSLRGRNLSYRRYTIDEIEKATEYFLQSRKIGEGGYGPVYKGSLDHTPVAIKVLRPDASQGRSQFQQEIEVLSCIRHPNLVLLLGACPEYGCLVYEYMANGSLEDRLMQQGNTPILSWQIRFRIAAEIATGLLFLHQTKPEPLVHRDLKPANILLDRNYVSKISDVGLARLVPPSVANSVTQYHMTATAGTFCYIDPEYQQTGMLGVKSDIYSLGVMLLQMITAKPPMGLTHHVEQAIEGGNLEQMLDPGVPDWPVDEAFKFAKLSLQCAELRRKDRPDLSRVIVPELNRLRALADDNMPNLLYMGVSPFPSSASIRQGSRSDPQLTGYQQSRSHPNTIT